MINDSAIIDETAKPVLKAEDDPNFVADARTKQPDAGAGENAETDEEKAEKETARLATEKQARKDTALAAGKTEEDFEKEETEAAANVGKTPEQIAEDKKAADLETKNAEIEAIRKETRAQFLKDMGVGSEEELKAKLNPAKAKTPEEIEAEAQIYNADLAKFAVTQKILNNKEWLEVHNMRNATDHDLVYNDFATTYRELNKDRVDEDKKADPVTDDEIKDKYNELYHLDSDNKVLKERGEKSIELQAKAIRQPLETKYNDAKLIYDDEMAETRAVPEFKKFFQGVILANIPDTLEYGEGDSKVVLGLEKLDKEELEKYFIKEIGDREFTDFRKGNGSPEQRARIEKEVRKEILYRYDKEIAKRAYENGESAGTKKSAPGANTRFIEPNKQGQQSRSITISEADQAKIAKDMARI